jgi:hypothetical protein
MHDDFCQCAAKRTYRAATWDKFVDDPRLLHQTALPWHGRLDGFDVRQFPIECCGD